ncbi:alpha/beta fold hydrolase [Streptomyces sp. NPDC055025]
MLEEFVDAYAEVDGIRIHYVAGGQGEPLVLLPGWPRTWYQFHKMMPTLAQSYRVIAVDLRGMGDSDKPASGYDKKTMAHDIYSLIKDLGYTSVNIAGEDIGSMVAYSFAANHPEATRKVALWEVGHPGEPFNDLRVLPQPGRPTAPWWFAFNQLRLLPEQLLQGRFRFLVDWLIDYQAKNPDAFSEKDRALYAEAYDTPDAIRAANAWYQTFGQDIEDGKTYPVLTMPLLGLGGIYYPFVPALLEGKAADAHFVEFEGAGHYLAEERPDDLARELTSFFG